MKKQRGKASALPDIDLSPTLIRRDGEPEPAVWLRMAGETYHAPPEGLTDLGTGLIRTAAEAEQQYLLFRYLVDTRRFTETEARDWIDDWTAWNARYREHHIEVYDDGEE